MRLSTLPATLLLVMTASLPALGVSVTNRDQKPHKLILVDKDGAPQSEHVVKPAETVDIACTKGCFIRLDGNDQDEYVLDGSETVSIEDGVVYYEGPAPEAKPSEEKSQPSPPAKKP